MGSQGTEQQGHPGRICSAAQAQLVDVLEAEDAPDVPDVLVARLIDALAARPGTEAEIARWYGRDVFAVAVRRGLLAPVAVPARRAAKRAPAAKRTARRASR